MGRKRVGGRGKGGHRDAVSGHDLAAFRIKAHGTPSGQQKQLAFPGQRHEFVRAGESPFPAPPADHQQIGIVKNIALGVGHDHMGDWGMRHTASPCSIWVERI